MSRASTTRCRAHHFHSQMDLQRMTLNIVKRILRKASDKREHQYLARLAYRSSSLACGKSQAELLFGRKMRTRLPYRNETYIRKSPPHDRGKLLKELNPNDTVHVKNPRHGRWLERAKVVCLCGPRSYEVRCDDGRLVHCNREHLLATHERFQPTPAEVTTLQDLTDELPVVQGTTTINAPTKPVPTEVDESTHDRSPVSSTPPVRRYPERVRKAPVRLDL